MRWNNNVLMLGQRRRRWANIKTSQFQRVMSVGSTKVSLASNWLAQCRVATVDQHYTSLGHVLHWSRFYGIQKTLNVQPMFGQRCRTWLNIKSTLGQRFMFGNTAEWLSFTQQLLWIDRFIQHSHKHDKIRITSVWYTYVTIQYNMNAGDKK